MIRVLIVDDHQMVREGLGSILDDAEDIDVTAEASSGEHALHVLEGVPADVALIDVKMKGMSGIELCRRLRDTHPDIKSLMVTVFTSDTAMASAFDAGARGYMFKNAPANSVIQAVRTVASGAIYVDTAAADQLIALATRGRPRVREPNGLTTAERRVIELLPRGLTNEEMGLELGVSANTIKSHLKHAMAKLDVHTRMEAAAFASKEGIG